MMENRSRLEYLDTLINDLYENYQFLKEDEFYNYKIYRDNKIELIKHNCRVNFITLVGMGTIAAQYVTISGNIDLGMLLALGIMGSIKISDMVFKKFNASNERNFKLISEETTKQLNYINQMIEQNEDYYEMRNYLKYFYNNELLPYDIKNLFEIMEKINPDDLSKNFSSDEIKIFEDEIEKYYDEKGYQKTLK